MNIKKIIIVAVLIVSFHALSAQTIEIVSPDYVWVGDTFTVNVTLNVTDSVGARFDLLFDNTILTGLSIDADLINTTCSSNPYVSPLTGINNTSGKVIFEEVCLGGTVTGTGNIAVITFNATNAGISNLNLENIKIKNTTGYDMPYTYTNNKTITVKTCDLNNDGIIIHDYNDLIFSYKCFLGIERNCKINYQDWKQIKEEYECFVGS